MNQPTHVRQTIYAFNGPVTQTIPDRKHKSGHHNNAKISDDVVIDMRVRFQKLHQSVQDIHHVYKEIPPATIKNIVDYITHSKHCVVW